MFSVGIDCLTKPLCELGRVGFSPVNVDGTSGLSHPRRETTLAVIWTVHELTENHINIHHNPLPRLSKRAVFG